MGAELRVQLGDLADGGLHAVRHCGASAFSGAAGAPRASSVADRCRQVLDHLVEFVLEAVGTLVVRVGLGLVDVALEVANSLLVVATCRRVDRLAGRRLLGHRPGEVEAVHLGPAGLDQPHDVGNALGRPNRNRPTEIRELAHVAEPGDRRRRGAGRRGRADRSGARSFGSQLGHDVSHDGDHVVAGQWLGRRGRDLHQLEVSGGQRRDGKRAGRRHQSFP